MEVFILGLENAFRGSHLIDYFTRNDVVTKVVYGIDGRVPTSELTQLMASDSRIKQITGRKLNSAEVATVLGHRKVYQEFLATKSAWALVLEDDAIPNENMNLDFLQVRDISTPVIVDLSGMERLVESYTKFPCLIMDAQDISQSDRRFIVYRTIGITFGAWAYLINRSAAEIAVNNFTLVDSNSDWPYTWRNKITFARPEKCLFSVRLEGSLTEKGRSETLNSTIPASCKLRQNLFIRRTNTFLGLVSIKSIIASFQGLGFAQHYKEQVLLPFLLRRIPRLR